MQVTAIMVVQDKETIKDFCKETFEIEMEDVGMSYKGWNWGESSIEGACTVGLVAATPRLPLLTEPSHPFFGLHPMARPALGPHPSAIYLRGLAVSFCSVVFEICPASRTFLGPNIVFKVEDRLAMEIPLTDIAQATAVKNEAVIEMGDDDSAMPDDEVLVEVRFHIPAPTGDDAADMEGTAAERFVEQIKEGGDLEKAGTAFATFEDVPIQVPRGRYDVEMFDKYMKLHGKTFDYKVMYTNVGALYLLPRPDGVNMALCVTLENPLRQVCIRPWKAGPAIVPFRSS